MPSASASRARRLPELDRRIRAGIAEIGFPGQPSHPICHGVGARAHEPPYAHQAGGGEIREGMVLAIEPGCYWDGRRRIARRGQLPDHLERCREAESRSRTGSCRRDRPEQDLDGHAERAGTRSAAARDGRALRHDAARRRAVRRRRAVAGGQARDREGAGRRGDRPDRGRLSACLRRRLARRRARLGCRAAGRGVGLLARRSGRRRGARRARRARLGDREPDLGREAGGARRLAREDARADPRARSRSPPAPGSRSRSSASTPPAPIPSSTAAPTRRPSRRVPRRSSSSTRSGSRRRRRPRTSSGRPSTGSAGRSRCTGTGTTTSASAPRPRSPPCRRARRGCRGRSTGWASGRGTPTWSRSRSPSRRSTGFPRVST